MKGADWQKTIELLKFSCTAPAGIVMFAYFIPSTTPEPLHVRQWSCENHHAWDRFLKNPTNFTCYSIYLNHFPEASASSTNGCERIHTNLQKPPVQSLQTIPWLIFAKKIKISIQTNTYFSCTFTRRANIFSCIGQVSSPIYIQIYMSFSQQLKERWPWDKAGK